LGFMMVGTSPLTFWWALALLNLLRSNVQSSLQAIAEMPKFSLFLFEVRCGNHMISKVKFKKLQQSLTAIACQLL
jgi:hypothetical protein